MLINHDVSEQEIQEKPVPIKTCLFAYYILSCKRIISLYSFLCPYIRYRQQTRSSNMNLARPNTQDANRMVTEKQTEKRKKKIAMMTITHTLSHQSQPPTI